MIYKNIDYTSPYIREKINTLPGELCDYLNHELLLDKINNPIIISKAINMFFVRRDLIDSLIMALRCNQIVEHQKVGGILVDK